MATVQDNDITICESGIKFGIYNTEDCYIIEDSQGHKSLGDGFKMVEFTLLRPEGLYIIEAKTSIPRPASIPDYDNFWHDIIEKMDNALQLHVIAHIKRNNIAYNELPSKMKEINWQSITFLLRLVIPGVPDMHLPQLTDAFRMRATKLKRKWILKDLHIAVINESKAKNINLAI